LYFQVLKNQVEVSEYDQAKQDNEIIKLFDEPLIVYKFGDLKLNLKLTKIFLVQNNLIWCLIIKLVGEHFN